MLMMMILLKVGKFLCWRNVSEKKASTFQDYNDIQAKLPENPHDSSFAGCSTGNDDLLYMICAP